jgi:hypothetical protein
MALIEVRTTGIEMPVHELDQLEARLGDVFDYILGTVVRSDVRINLWHPAQVIGGELTPMEEGMLLDEIMRAIYSVSGPLHQERQPRVEFVIAPETPREEVQKQIADTRFQISERHLMLEQVQDQPSTKAMLLSEIERLETSIQEMESKLAEMPDGEDAADAA